MPKVEIDYSNTIIYKITCKELSVTDVYVGHTTNFVQRKHAHKQSCSNIKSGNYNCKLYKVIRENGGWQNWTMEIVNFFNCYDHYEARKKEQEYFLSLNATLNSIEPMPKPKDKINPNDTDKHKKILANDDNHTTELFPNNTFFSCEKCDFKCCKKGDWNRHILTSKHINVTSCDDVHKNTSKYTCVNCEKCFKSRNGAWSHKKKCVKQPDNNDTIDSNLIVQLLKQNEEFKTMLLDQNNKILEICKNNIVNSHNKSL